MFLKVFFSVLWLLHIAYADAFSTILITFEAIFLWTDSKNYFTTNQKEKQPTPIQKMVKEALIQVNYKFKFHQTQKCFHVRHDPSLKITPGTRNRDAIPLIIF